MIDLNEFGGAGEAPEPGPQKKQGGIPDHMAEALEGALENFVPQTPDEQKANVQKLMQNMGLAAPSGPEHEFTAMRAPREVLDVLNSNDEERVRGLIKGMRAAGDIPAEWPDIRLTIHEKSGNLHGADFETSVLLTCVATTATSEEFRDKLPGREEVRDHIWYAHENFVFIWDAKDSALQQITRDGNVSREESVVTHLITTWKALQAKQTLPFYKKTHDTLALKELVLQELIARTSGDPDVIGDMLHATGIDADTWDSVVGWAQRSQQNTLLEMSPAYLVVKCVVTLTLEAEGELNPGQSPAATGVFFTKVAMHQQEYKDDPGILTRLAIESATAQAHRALIEGVKVQAPSNISAVTEGTRDFDLYARAPEWGSLPRQEWILSPQSLNRVLRWDDIEMEPEIEDEQ